MSLNVSYMPEIIVIAIISLVLEFMKLSPMGLRNLSMLLINSTIGMWLHVSFVPEPRLWIIVLCTIASFYKFKSVCENFSFVSLSSVQWVLQKTFHLLPAICSFSSFQKYFSKRTRKQKCNLHLINMKSLFGLLHLISGFSWYWNHLWFTSRSGKTSWPLWVCINLRMCPRLLASHLQHDFSGLAERNVWNL